MLCHMNHRYDVEFVHAALAQDVTEDHLVATMLAFEERVLGPRGFLFHALLRNGSGRFAHFVVAPSAGAFHELEHDAARVPEIAALFACFDLESARVFRHRILGDAPELPEVFGVLEHGTFKPRQGAAFSPASLEGVARRVREEYLAHEPGHLAQFVADVGEGRYAEVVFGASLAHARRTCARYPEVAACGPLLALCAPESVELDFWTPLLVRRLARPS